MTNSRALKPKHLFFCLFLFLCGQNFSVKAQNPRYEMLWKISGKNLKNPSYLFGSIHVKDRTVFNFSDSVMQSIAKTSAFVLELNPDSMLTYLYDENKAGNLKTQLSDEQKEKVAKKYQQKYGIEPDESQLNNPLFVSSIMRPDVDKDDDMNTFLDAYLYGIAKTQGKKIFGLEKPEDQLATYLNHPDKIEALFDLDEDTANVEFEKLVELYAGGSLKEIEDYAKAYIDETLNKRNNVMLNGILALLKKETIFVCVGVAHLPSEQGLIELLRKQGYQVTLEPASFTGISKKYTIDPKKFKWHNYETPEYSISFPSIPFTAKKTIEMRMTSLPDLMSGLTFGVVSAYAPQKDSALPLDSIAKLVSNKTNLSIIKKNNWVKNGVKILEFEVEKDGKKSISRVFYQNNYFYTLTIDNIHKETDPAYFNLFFDSFNAKKQSISSNKWLVSKYDAEAFTISTPVTPEVQEIASQEPLTRKNIKISMFMAPDFARKMNYIYRCNDFPEGYYMADKTAAFNAAINQAGKKGKLVGEPSIIYKDGYEGRALNVIVANTYMEFRIYLRGNRQYVLLRQNLSGPIKPDDDEFFKSFQFLPYQKSDATPFAVKNVTNIWPGKPNPAPQIDDEDEDKTTHFLNLAHTYQHTNKNTGGMYILEYSGFSKYYRNATVDSVYNHFGNELRSNLVEIIQKDFTIGTVQGKEIIGIDTLSGNMKRSRIWLQDENLILQQLATTKEEMESNAAQAFFNETKTTGKPFSFDLKASKAALIIKDLKSIDTTTQKYAKGALEFYSFDKDELLFLYQGMKHYYADDTISYGTKGLLINHLKILKDKNAVPVLKTTYNDLKNGDEIRAKALADIPILDSTQYNWYLDELKATNLKLKNYWDLFEPLTDSLAYVANNFKSFLTLLDKKDYRKNTLSIVSDMLVADSIPTYKSLVSQNAKSITKYAMADLEEDIELLKTAAYPNTAYHYLNVLPKLDIAIADQFTNKIIGLDSVGFLKTRAVEVRIKAKLPISKEVLAEQLDSLASRYTIMFAYNEIDELDKVPSKYKEPSEFGRLLLYDYVSEDYELENITTLGEVEYENQVYYVYSYDVIDEDEKIRYLGIAGAFNKNNRVIDFEKQYAHSNFEKLETDWKKQAKVLIEQLAEN
jgi:uncharacterized protein YbaP (TraB family)